LRHVCRGLCRGQRRLQPSGWRVLDGHVMSRRHGHGHGGHVWRHAHGVHAVLRVKMGHRSSLHIGRDDALHIGHLHVAGAHGTAVVRRVASRVGVRSVGGLVGIVRRSFQLLLLLLLLLLDIGRGRTGTSGCDEFVPVGLPRLSGLTLQVLLVLRVRRMSLVLVCWMRLVFRVD